MGADYLMPSLIRNRGHFLKYRADALQVVQVHLARFNELYNFQYQRVTIRNQRSRWGSCSRRGNLSFNYKIALLPSRIAEYIVVHELCHLKELNHSPRFWNLVALAIPDYKAIKKELRSHDLEVIELHRLAHTA